MNADGCDAVLGIWEKAIRPSGVGRKVATLPLEWEMMVRTMAIVLALTHPRWIQAASMAAKCLEPECKMLFNVRVKCAGQSGNFTTQRTHCRSEAAILEPDVSCGIGGRGVPDSVANLHSCMES
jgi:hypothetical protein